MGIFHRTVNPTDAPAAKARKCPKSASTSPKRALATHSMHLTGELAGRRLALYRVEMDKCRHCSTLTRLRGFAG